MAAIFADRSDAGSRLARALEQFRGARTVVLGIPRGGVPVAKRVSDALGAPLDVVRLDGSGKQPWADIPSVDLIGARVIIVDDGVATGATARAACRAVRQRGAAEIILAVPVAPPDWTHTLDGEADDFVAVATPHPFWSVGQWYSRFEPTSIDNVLAALARTDRKSGRGDVAFDDGRVQCETSGGFGDQHTPGAPMAANSFLELR